MAAFRNRRAHREDTAYPCPDVSRNAMTPVGAQCCGRTGPPSRVHSERLGVLGGIGFTASSVQRGPRDDVVGRSADAHVANIGRVVFDHRISLLPGVRVRGLASTVLRPATERIADDWRHPTVCAASRSGFSAGPDRYVVNGDWQPGVRREHASGRSDQAAMFSCQW